ncbi:MAG: hypothetical protein IPJ65_38065 [Archangiaceae bacterium]|nr:hypothetical protein [Archangiaceae bacterium]
MLRRIRFCDATIAGAFRGAARTQLDQLVEQAGSYLNVWKEDNKLRSAKACCVARRPSAGFATASGCCRETGGGVSSSRTPKQLRTALQVLRNADVDLEAAQNPPPELQQATDDAATTDDGPARSSGRGSSSAFSPEPSPSGGRSTAAPIDSDDREPPESGVLFLSVSGDRKRLERRSTRSRSSRLPSARCP